MFVYRFSSKHSFPSLMDDASSPSSVSAATIPLSSTFTPPTSLCPGYKQVEAFSPDDDYYSDDNEEDVSYVTLDLGDIEPTLVPSSSTYRLIGLDTPTPFLQLSGTILRGRHDSLLGTELLFTDGNDIDKAKRSITFTGSTSQRISFREVQLVPKGPSRSAPSSPLNEKLRSKGKRKGKAVEGNDEPEIAIIRGGDPQMVDRVTGKVAPRARVPRGKRRKTKTGSDEDMEEDMDGRGNKQEKPKVKAKLKGKEKPKRKSKKELELELELELDQDGNEDGADAGADETT